jgi:hypothetical protein
MSLVNDALKRAKEAQQPTPAPPISGPPFKEIDTVQVSARWITSPITMVVVAVIALFVVWQLLQRGNESSGSEGNNTQVAARSSVTPGTSPATVEPPSSKPEPEAGVAPGVTVVTNEAPADPASLAKDHAQEEIVPPAPPAPPPLRLQAVIWNPKRPSAIISGKTVFVGDEIQDFKVTRINQDSATLSGSSGSKEMKIGQ